jgi:hypothetical protein
VNEKRELLDLVSPSLSPSSFWALSRHAGSCGSRRKTVRCSANSSTFPLFSREQNNPEFSSSFCRDLTCKVPNRRLNEDTAELDESPRDPFYYI